MKRDVMLFYKLRSGAIVETYEIERAFMITTGKYRFEDEVGYLRWLYATLGKSIVKVYNLTNDPWLSEGIIRGVKKYRDDRQCTLKEAHDFIHGYMNKIFNKED